VTNDLIPEAGQNDIRLARFFVSQLILPAVVFAISFLPIPYNETTCNFSHFSEFIA
jgi:hypothetical protein